MRPTRTAGLTVIAIAVSVAWAVLGAPLATAANPVPAAPLEIDPRCAEVTWLDEGGGELLDIDLQEVDGLPGAIRGQPACIANFDGSEPGEVSEFLDLVYLDDAWSAFRFLAEGLVQEGWTFWNGSATSQAGETLTEAELLEFFALSTPPPGEVSAFLGSPNHDPDSALAAEHRDSTWHLHSGDEEDVWLRYSPAGTGAAPFDTTVVKITRVMPEAAPAAVPERVGISSPSTVSDLNTIAQSAPGPFETFVLLASGVLLTLLVGYPGYLLTGVLTARWDRWFGWAKRPTAAVRRIAERNQAPWVFWVGIAVASLIAAFIEPSFGLNWMSLRLYLTLFAAFVVFNVGAWLVIGRVLRRTEPEARPTMRFRLGSLVVLVVAVLISRLLTLDPGIVFGLVAGLVFATSLLATRRAHVVLIGSGYAAAAGVIAWIIYSVLSATVGSIDNGFAVGAVEFFGGLTIQGVASLPLALLPLATLDGAQLFGWNRVYWAITYLLASVLFVLVMLNVPGGLTAVPGDFLRWLGLYVAFAVFATAVWGIDLLIERRSQGAVPSEGRNARATR